MTVVKVDHTWYSCCIGVWADAGSFLVFRHLFCVKWTISCLVYNGSTLFFLCCVWSDVLVERGNSLSACWARVVSSGSPPFGVFAIVVDHLEFLF